MLVQKSKLKPLVHQTDDGKVEVSEYGGLDKGMDLGVATITGNYPGEGKFTCNREVETMTFFILSGECRFYFKNGDEFELHQGDCVFIGKGKMYKVEVDEGESVEVLMTSNPAWSPEQVEVS